MGLIRGVMLASLFLLTVVSVSARETREVIMRIGLPNGASPELRVVERETGSVSLPKVGTFGFVPVATDDKTATITVLDLTNGERKQIAEVTLSVGAGPVPTDSTPQFNIRLLRVVRHQQ